MRRTSMKMISAVLSVILSLSMLAIQPTVARAAGGLADGKGNTELFGPNVYVFGPQDSQTDIQATIDAIYAKQEKAQFGTDRYAVLFKPGTYNAVRAKVGFYTQIAGLGTLPTDTVVNELDLNADWMGANATCNFWRSASNFTVNKTTTWAAAQATSLRRMQFNEMLALDQWGQGWASGGFVADTVVEGQTVAWSEQQYISRNSDFGSWEGGVWNAVFVGMKDGLTAGGKPLQSNWNPDPGYQYFTEVETAPLIREEPYLTVDGAGNYSVFVPALRTNAVGTSWANGSTQGTSIGIDQFYIAKPGQDTADSMNAALASGKNPILTPGIYSLDKAIRVNNPNTVVLGLGYATLTPTGNNACMEVADVDGASVSGLLFDAGPAYTETLLKVGNTGAQNRHASNPILLSDLFFRVGGATSNVAQSETCLIINSKDVIGDNFWVWRADHGDGVAWNLNKTKNGIVINGDNMTMYGLFVEHFHEYQTVWNGNNGRCYFYQSEMPYDVPNQAAWMSHGGSVNGYASYKVGDNVTSHDARGLGIYSFHRDATVDANTGMEVPDVNGVGVTNVCTVMLAGNPGISHVLNNQGGAVVTAGQRQQVVTYGNAIINIPSEPEEPVNTALKIEAENYTAMQGVATENCSDTDGGQNVGWIDAGDWMDYQVIVPASGTYKANLRVKGWNANAAVDIMTGGSVLGTANVNTGSRWTTVPAGEFALNQGTNTLRVYAKAGGFNLNWIELTAGAGTTTPEVTENTTNFALNRPVAVSSVEGNYQGSNAVDGNTGSRWASLWNDAEWLSVDLGSQKEIRKVALNWEAAYGKSYRIQVSNDGTVWNTVATVTNGDGGADEVTFGMVDARYVRVEGIARGTGYGYSIYEFGVY